MSYFEKVILNMLSGFSALPPQTVTEWLWHGGKATMVTEVHQVPIV